jgi:hypothetical protein
MTSTKRVDLGRVLELYGCIDAGCIVACHFVLFCRAFSRNTLLYALFALTLLPYLHHSSLSPSLLSVISPPQPFSPFILSITQSQYPTLVSPPRTRGSPPVKSPTGSMASEYSWRDMACFRFPLPEGVLSLAHGRKYSAAEYSAVQYSVIKYNTVQFSRVQCSTV